MTKPRATPVSVALPAALTDHAGYLAVLLGQRARRAFEAAIATLDLRPMQYDYLATVADHGPTSQRELAAALSFDPARIVALTDELERRGLVVRTADTEDRRRNHIGLTREGRALTRRVHRISLEVEAQLLAELSEAERKAIRALMRRALGLS